MVWVASGGWAGFLQFDLQNAISYTDIQDSFILNKLYIE